MSASLLRLIASLCFVCIPVLSACGDDASDEHDDHDDAHEEGEELGDPTGATCPTDAGTLTYEDFGKPFMEEFCTRCHSSELEGAARNGAPAEHDFDTEAGILLVAEHIDQMAASGPDATNTKMPESGVKPSMAQREMLGQWLACELGE